MITFLPSALLKYLKRDLESIRPYLIVCLGVLKCKMEYNLNEN